MRKDLFEILLKNQHILHCYRPTESTIIFLRVFFEEGGRCCTVMAVRYFADGLTLSHTHMAGSRSEPPMSLLLVLAFCQ
jgi:hypothetical protein